MKINFARAIGYLWRRYAPFEACLPEAGQEDLQVLKEVRPFTMTSPERIYGLMNAVRYVLANQVPGAIVECGVWRGGSMMATAKTLLRQNCKDRDLYLFDTFAGMTAPTPEDGSNFDRQTPQQTYTQMRNQDGSSQWCFSSLEDTRRNMLRVGYPEDKIHLVKGPVEETIPQNAPQQIALLRLDTDFYSSSKHEMEHLYPRLIKGGVLLLDDYGHWEGQRRAVDEYFAKHKNQVLLNRLDYTGRIGVKT
jgi:hypothetical protein